MKPFGRDSGFRNDVQAPGKEVATNLHPVLSIFLNISKPEKKPQLLQRNNVYIYNYIYNKYKHISMYSKHKNL